MARKKAKANYFTKETEDYIVEFNNSNDIEYRNELFTKHIYYPFYKLAENIIHTFKFYYTDVDHIEDLKHEIVSLLYEEKIHKFDPTNGAKAYSYFGTIVKRWLINYNNKNYKKLKQIGSFDDAEDSYETEYGRDPEYGVTISKLMEEWIDEMYLELDNMFDKPADRQIADAVLMVFRSRNDLEIFKKKALYIYIREITNCETPSLTKVVNVLKGHWKTKFQFYYDQGYLTSNKSF